MSKNIGGSSIYGRATMGSPLFGRRDPGLFEIWRLWARELGLTYEPYRDLSEKKPLTGRRNPDIKPRQYDLNDKKYGMDPKTGTIWRRRESIPRS